MLGRSTWLRQSCADALVFEDNASLERLFWRMFDGTITFNFAAFCGRIGKGWA